MKKYSVHISEQAHESLRQIVKHKIEYTDELTAKRFSDGFYSDTESLASLPYRGFNLSEQYKAKIYNNHLIVYQILEPDEVRILDLIDPRQHTKAKKYY